MKKRQPIGARGGGTRRIINTSIVKFIKGSTDVLVMAPHGVNKKPRDDVRTDIIAAAIAEALECSALINDRIKRTVLNYNVRQDAASDHVFINNMRFVLDAHGHTLVLWIHGFNEKKRPELEQQLGVAGNRRLDCLIGYGQGVQKRLTANKSTIQRLLAVLADQGICAYEALPAPPGIKYCGYDLNNMNQWCRQQGAYNNKNKVESIQLEFKEPGFRKTDVQASALGVKIANAVRSMMRSTAEVIEPPVVHRATETYDTIK